MKKFLLLILAIFLSACASPTQPTAIKATVLAQPSSTAQPATAGTPQPTRPALAVQNVQQSKQPDGTIKTTANVSTQDNLGLGQIDLAYPDTMNLGDSSSVHLRLSPAQQLASLTPIAVPVKTPNAPNVAYLLRGNVQLYPIMYAQLRSTSFEIDQPQATNRAIQANQAVEWIWVIKPTSAGRHDLVIELSVPITVNGVASEFSTSVLQDLALTINVFALPTPTPPLTQRIFDSIINNSGAIVVALIGILGTLLGAMLTWLNRNNKKESK